MLSSRLSLLPGRQGPLVRVLLLSFVLVVGAVAMSGCSLFLKPKTQVMRTGPACGTAQRSYTRPAQLPQQPAAGSPAAPAAPAAPAGPGGAPAAPPAGSAPAPGGAQ